MGKITYVPIPPEWRDTHFTSKGGALKWATPRGVLWLLPFQLDGKGNVAEEKFLIYQNNEHGQNGLKSYGENESYAKYAGTSDINDAPNPYHGTSRGMFAKRTPSYQAPPANQYANPVTPAPEPASPIPAGNGIEIKELTQAFVEAGNMFFSHFGVLLEGIQGMNENIEKIAAGMEGINCKLEELNSLMREQNGPPPILNVEAIRDSLVSPPASSELKPEEKASFFKTVQKKPPAKKADPVLVGDTDLNLPV